MTARIARQRAVQLRGALSARDRALLNDLHRLSMLTSVQIERLHFREGSALTQARRCRRRLQQLTNDRLLHRYERRVGGVRAGSAGFVYALTPLGKAVIDDTSVGRRRKPWEVGRPFMRHLLAVSELYVQLREAERFGQFELVAFDGEPICWRDSRDGPRLVVLKPDAFVRLAVDDYEEHAFIEVDLGTESRNVIRRKAAGYLAHFQTGREQARSGVFPRVVFLAERTERAVVLARTLDAFDEHGLFRVGRLDRGSNVLLGEDEQEQQVTGGTNE